MSLLQDPVARGRLALAILVALGLLLVAPFVLGTDARHLSAYRDGPEELGLARAELAAVAGEVDAILATPHALADVDEPARTLYVAIGPERAYDESEVAAILAFLRAGGRVLLADEGGHGNAIAREAGYGFLSSRLLDSRNHQGDAQLVVAEARVSGDVAHRVLLNSPAALRRLPGAAGDPETLAWSSAAAYPNGSYVDIDGDGEVDLTDPVGPHPLVVLAPVGEGVLVLASDTGLFMDASLSLPEYDNAAFVRALAARLVPPDGLVLLDESRHAPAPLLSAWTEPLRVLGRATTGPVAPFVLVGLALAGTLLAWRLARPVEDWSRHGHDVGADVPAPEGLKPDLARAQRMARRRISERHNIPMEQVAGMTGEELLRLTGDKLLSEAAAGTLRSDPAPLFASFSREAPP